MVSSTSLENGEIEEDDVRSLVTAELPDEVCSAAVGWYLSIFGNCWATVNNGGRPCSS